MSSSMEDLVTLPLSETATCTARLGRLGFTLVCSASLVVRRLALPGCLRPLSPRGWNSPWGLSFLSEARDHLRSRQSRSDRAFAHLHWELRCQSRPLRNGE